MHIVRCNWDVHGWYVKFTCIICTSCDATYMHFRVQCIICSSRRRKHRPVALTSNVCNYDAHLMHIVLMHTYLYVLNMHLGRCMSDVHRHDAEIAVCFMHIKRSSSHALCLITKRSASEGNQAMYIAICICVYASEALNGCIDCIVKTAMQSMHLMHRWSTSDALWCYLGLHSRIVDAGSKFTK